MLLSTANTITNPSFETNSAWIASANDPNGDHSEGYTTAWASDGSQSYEFTRSAGSTSAGSWVGISQIVNLTSVSGLLFDCRDTGIDGAQESLQFLVDGSVVGQWANDGWPIGTVVDPTNSSNWGHTATTYNIEIPFNTAFTGNHTLTIREYTASSYDPSDPKIYDIDNLRELTGTTTTVAVTPNPSVYGQSVTVTATVGTTSNGVGMPTGTVAFEEGSTTVGTGTLNASGVATFSTSALSVGSDTITASYAGDTNFTGSSTVIGPNSIITTVAGSGTSYNGDGIAATAAELFPMGVAVDAAGDIFIADTVNARIREVNHLTGAITTVAGNGTFGYSGDGGQATAAELGVVEGIALDSAGDLFIADLSARVVREVNLSKGVINTFAGDGTKGYSGDGGEATAAELKGPSGVAVDAAGDLFIADGDRIREVNHATGVITTVAGNGIDGYSGDGGQATAAELFNPTGIAVDSFGDIFIADTDNNVIREVKNGVINTVAGNGDLDYSGDGGQATAAGLGPAQSVAVDAAGDLFISVGDRVREVSNGVITTFAGNGTYGYSGDSGQATAAELSSLEGVAIDAKGDLFIADSYNGRIREVNHATGVITTVAGDGPLEYSGDGGPATAAEMGPAVGGAVDAAGDLFIVDFGGNRIREVNHATGVITTVAGNGTAGYSGDNGPATLAELDDPTNIAVDAAGDLFIADGDRVREVNNGVITTVAGNGIDGYSGDGGPATAAELSMLSGEGCGLAVDAAGDLFIADGDRVREVNHATQIIDTVAGGGDQDPGDGGPATAAELHYPGDLAVDSASDLFIAEQDGNRICEVNLSTGIINTVAGTGIAGYSGDNGLATAAKLDGPTNIAVDAAGDLFIGDAGNSRIREVDLTTGVITTVAGDGTAGYSGDNGPATAAELGFAEGFALDSAGDLFIGDTFSGRIREIAAGTAVTVNPAPLTVTADDASKTYGQTLTFAGTEFTAVGLLNSDSVTGVTLSSAGAAATATVAGSPYAIVPSAAVGTGLDNYSITYDNGRLTVNPASLSVIVLSPTSLPNCQINVPYRQTISASGGNGTIALKVSDVQGMIPGLSLPTSGTGSLTISGTPTAAGFETFTVTATDSAGQSSSLHYEIDVKDAIAPVPSNAIFGTVFQDSNDNGVRDGSRTLGGTRYMVFAFDVASSTWDPSKSGSLDTPTVQDYEYSAAAGQFAQLIQAGVAQNLSVAIVLFAGDAVVLDMAPNEPFIPADTLLSLLNSKNGSLEIDVGPTDSSGTIQVQYRFSSNQTLTTTYLSGGTNYAAPLQQSREILAALPAGEAGSQVLLFADGEPESQGSHSALQNVVSQLRAASVAVHVYGFDSTACSPEDALANLQQIDSQAQLYADSDQAIDAFCREELQWSGEPGLADVTVYLEQNDDGRLDPGPSTKTDANGFYSFTGLSAGTYIVREVLPVGQIQTFPGPNEDDSQTVTVGGNSTVSFDSGNWFQSFFIQNVDFGNFIIPPPKPDPVKIDNAPTGTTTTTSYTPTKTNATAQPSDAPPSVAGEAAMILPRISKGNDNQLGSHGDLLPPAPQSEARTPPPAGSAGETDARVVGQALSMVLVEPTLPAMYQIEVGDQPPEPKPPKDDPSLLVALQIPEKRHPVRISDDGDDPPPPPRPWTWIAVAVSLGALAATGFYWSRRQASKERAALDDLLFGGLHEEDLSGGGDAASAAALAPTETIGHGLRT